MGVTLDLRLIDHERLVVGGLRAVNDAVRKHDPEILRSYLATLPVEVDPELVEHHTEQLAKLRKYEVPEVIIQIQEQSLSLVKGEPYLLERLQAATFDELRELLGTWCWKTHSFSLDKLWSALHWFLEPVAGPYYPTCPRYPEVSDPSQSILSKAMKGEVTYPKDDLGAPVIRTLGSPEPDCSGYNPPQTCKLVLEALRSVDTAAWEKLIPFRSELYWQEVPGMLEEEIETCIVRELSSAREALPDLLLAYERAVERGFGVSCEYSL